MKGTCRLDDCSTYGTVRKGLCDRHYWRLRKHGSVDDRSTHGWPLLDRLNLYAHRIPGGCWLWSAAVDHNGYGIIAVRISGRTYPRKAHRLMYEQVVGPILPGLDVDHLCRVRRCVNPEHLEAVTHRENVLRGDSPSAVAVRRLETT